MTADTTREFFSHVCYFLFSGIGFGILYPLSSEVFRVIRSAFFCPFFGIRYAFTRREKKQEYLAFLLSERKSSVSSLITDVLFSFLTAVFLLVSVYLSTDFSPRPLLLLTFAAGWALSGRLPFDKIRKGFAVFCSGISKAVYQTVFLLLLPASTAGRWSWFHVILPLYSMINLKSARKNGERQMRKNIGLLVSACEKYDYD